MASISSRSVTPTPLILFLWLCLAVPLTITSFSTILLLLSLLPYCGLVLLCQLDMCTFAFRFLAYKRTNQRKNIWMLKYFPRIYIFLFVVEIFTLGPTLWSKILPYIRNFKGATRKVDLHQFTNSSCKTVPYVVLNLCIFFIRNRLKQ